MPKRTSSYHSWLLGQLSDPKIAADYVDEAIKDNVAEARTMKKVATVADVSRETLYRTLSEEGNPTWKTLSALLAAVGLRVRIESEQEPAQTEPGAASIERASGIFEHNTSGNLTNTRTASSGGILFVVSTEPSIEASKIVKVGDVNISHIISASTSSEEKWIGRLR
jgi:probable addiction module antidote protein